MTTTTLVLLGLAAVAVILGLIIKGKVHPFLALMIAAAALALAGGIPLGEVVPTLTTGMGNTLGSVALIVTLGAMLGRIIEVSGGADVLARWLLDKFGEKRAPFALGATGFIFGIPVFVDVGLIVLIPIVFGVARRLGGNMLAYALPIVIAMLTVHVIVPPHPGIVGGSELLGADIGLVLLLSFIPAIPMWLFGHWLAMRLSRKAHVEITHDDVLQSVGGSGHTGVVMTKAPSTGLVLSMIALPLLLIMLQTTSALVLAEGNPVRTLLSMVGASPMALLIGVILASILLGYRRGWGREETEHVINSALPPVAAVILITGAGGMFGYVLRETGVSEAVADVLGGTGLPIILLAYIMAALIRAAQGSATVAILTTAPLMAPLAAAQGLTPVQTAILALAIGVGSMALSHVNDSLFWVWSRYFQVPTGVALRTYTVLCTATSVVGFVVVSVLWFALSGLS